MILLGVPTHDGRISIGTSRAITQAVEEEGAQVRYAEGSLLCLVFNTLWAAALNDGADEFVMLHADVRPRSSTWLSDLIKLRRDHSLDVLSLAIPIKDGSGETSTALQGPPVRRLRAEEIGHIRTGKDLLINTGCMAVDFTRLWVREFPGFHMSDTLLKTHDGYVAECQSEDWTMSRYLSVKGIPYGATASIPVTHFGIGHWECEKITI